MFTVKVRTCFSHNTSYTGAIKSWTPQTHSLETVVGLKGFMKSTWGCDKCTLRTKPLKNKSLKLFVLLMFFVFCLRTSKDSSMGKFDKL